MGATTLLPTEKVWSQEPGSYSPCWRSGAMSRRSTPTFCSCKPPRNLVASLQFCNYLTLMKGNKYHYPELMVHPGDCWNWPSSASWKSLLCSTRKDTKYKQITEFVYSRSKCDELPSVRGSVVVSGSMWAAEGLLLVIHSWAEPVRWTASPSHGEPMGRGAPHWRYWQVLTKACGLRRVWYPTPPTSRSEGPHPVPLSCLIQDETLRVLWTVGFRNFVFNVGLHTCCHL